MPESPRYLVINKNLEEQGRNTLRSIRDSESQVDEEMQEYASARKEFSQNSRVTVKELLVSSIECFI